MFLLKIVCLYELLMSELNQVLAKVQANVHKFASGCKGPECVTGGALKTTNMFMKLKRQVHIYST